MLNNSFVEIEDKKMPVDKFKEIDFDKPIDNRNGFINLVFLSSIVVSSFMWILLVFFRK